MAPVSQQRDVYVAPLQKPAKPRVHSNPRPADADAFADDAVLKGVLFSGTLLSAVSVEVLEMEASRFVSARLNGTSFRQCVISDTEFDSVDLANARAQDTSLLKCRVTTSRLTGSHWRSGHLTDVVFDGCRGDLAQFRQSKIRRVRFEETNLQQADFQGAELAHVVFEGCNLSGAQFANAALSRVEFVNCTMVDIGGTAGLKGATVRGPGAMELGLSLAREAGIVIE